MTTQNSNDELEALRKQVIENAAEINRLHHRINETYKRRDESAESREEWSKACAEFHSHYDELCLPGGPYPDFFDRLRNGDSRMIEVALCFLEVRPYFFRSGYHWKAILQKCKSAPMSEEQSERFHNLFEKYQQWRKLRKASSERGAAIKHRLWPLLREFYNVFPVEIANYKYDGVATVGDLYRILCIDLRVEPLVDPSAVRGKVHIRCYAVPEKDTTAWVGQYDAWRRAVWSADDIWATLESLIREVWGLDQNSEISTETVLVER